MNKYRTQTKSALRTAGLLVALVAAVSNAAPVINLAQLADAAGAQPVNLSIELEGTVLWSSESGGRVILQDATATQMLELQLACDMPGQGERVRLEGECAAIQSRDALVLSSVPVVENNGPHAFIEKSGTMHLKAGMHPVRLAWFDRTGECGLSVEYEGPGISRQAIPDTVLNGLEYRCYEGSWWRQLPNYDHMVPVASGMAPNFDIGVRTRDKHVGLQFAGLLNVEREGDYTFFVSSDDGSRLFVGPPTLNLRTIGRGELPAPRTVPAADEPEFQWSEIEGDVTAVYRSCDALELEVMTEAGPVRVQVAENPESSIELKPHSRIRATGVSRRIRSAGGGWMRGEFYVQRLEHAELSSFLPQNGESDSLPTLTTLDQVYQLGLEESSRKYPVRVRGVITSPMQANGAVLQDSSRGIYVALGVNPIHLQAGDYCEVKGTTGPYQFSPYIEATRVEVLGAAGLPEPVVPSWDQLINGSLHCVYVELEGIVASFDSDRITLLTRGGRINVRLNPVGAKMPDNVLGSTIRLRGCLRADWDGASRRVVVGSIFLDQNRVQVVEPAPDDPFRVGYKRVDDLLQFDPEAGALQRVRVWGQLIHKGADVCCLMDGGSGLRFVPSSDIPSVAGDMVDVSGFLELGSAAPVLREAMVRTTGHEGMPEPVRLDSQNLLRDEYDSTCVSIEGVLLGIGGRSGKTVLELQNGLRRFAAELDGDVDTEELVPGSRLELTGAYIGLGGNRVLGRPIDSFKLLLNSDADITVLSSPPWWTLRRMLSVVGLLAAVLVAALIWIKLLHRKVEQRTVELGNQIRERQRAEHQRQIEQERARLAHDLHDDLGARLTEVNMLASLVEDPQTTAEERKRYAEQLSEIALHMVTSLDEIVWAVNPRNDTVASLAGYFGAYAQRLLELASISCGLDVADRLPDVSLDSRFRQEMFLAFKEALANVIQHAAASKVWLRIFVQNDDLTVIVSDNGTGFAFGEKKVGADGLANMRERMDALSGQCIIESDPDTGTSVHLQAPIQKALE